MRLKRPVQTHLHTAASPRVYREKHGAPRHSIEEYVRQKTEAGLAGTCGTAREGVSHQLLPRNLVDTELEAPKAVDSHSVFSRPNR